MRLHRNASARVPRSCFDRRRAASAANAGLIFVLLQRVAHALGVGEGCPVTTSYPEVRSDHHHVNSFRTAPSLCADMIFGKDKGVRCENSQKGLSKPGGPLSLV